MKTLKVAGVYPLAFASAEDVAEHMSRFTDSYNVRRLLSALGYLSPNNYEEEDPQAGQSCRVKLSGSRSPFQRGQFSVQIYCNAAQELHSYKKIE